MLPCVYQAETEAAASRSRLRAAARGTVIAESRDRRDHSSPSTSPSTKLPAFIDSPPYDSAYFNSLVPLLMIRLHPFAPFVDEADIWAVIELADTDRDAAFTVHAYASAALLLDQQSREWKPNCCQHVFEMVTLAIEHLPPTGLDSRPSFNRVLGYLFLEMCFLGLRRLNLAFFYLRSAISLILMEGLENFLGMAGDDPVERTRRERIYWFCFIHERHIAIEHPTPLCLDPLPSLPNVTSLAANSIERGYNCIIETYLLVDRDFIRFWNGDRSLVTAEWIQEKQRQLTDPEWEHEITTLSTAQLADLIITRQWLRTLTWQMAVSNALLSSDTSQPEALWLFMPIRLTTQIKEGFMRMAHQGISVEEMTIRDKLFEIITTIADIVVALPASSCAEETLSIIQDLLLFKRVHFGFAHVKPSHREILLEKLCHIKSLYRDTMSTEMLEALDFDPPVD